MEAAPTPIYRTLDSVLEVLDNCKESNVETVENLLDIYNTALADSNSNFDPSAKKHPFIVLEGLDGSGKSTVGFKLSKQLGAKQWCTPPKSIKPIRDSFDDHPTLRTAYYALGNYIAALEVTQMLPHQPVVMDRYWHSTCAFAIAQSVNDYPGRIDMPPAGDDFYQWPCDLLKPDKVLFLNVNEKVRQQRLSRRTTSTSQEELLKTSDSFRNNVVLAYRNMVDPPVTFVDANLGFGTVLREIRDKTSHLFNQ